MIKFTCLGVGLLAVFAGGMPSTAAAEPAAARTHVVDDGPQPRMIVLTDMEADQDDAQSLVRLMLYANEVDIEGLIATTSTHMRHELHPETIRRILDAYAKVQPNLLKHDWRYPAAAKIFGLISTGQPDYGMAAVGTGKDTTGSNAIIRALESPDPRPLWVTVWGGPNTLAQALFTLKATHRTAETSRLLAKLRVATISDQDDSGAWIRRTFPDLFYALSPGGYGHATWGAIMDVVDGIDNRTISNAWLRENIQQGHGPLGAAYPDVAYGMEGDTPSYLPLIPNGLNDAEHPNWGGWGGRFELYTPVMQDLDLTGFTGGVPIEPETRPIWTNASDTFAPFRPGEYGRAMEAGRRTFSGARVSLWRWRDDFQNDFAARIGWTTLPYEKANHPPLVRLAGPDHLTVHSGEVFTLSAEGTTDPDGDSLSYLWFNYTEAGTLKTPIPTIGAENIFHMSFKAPVVSKPETAHFLLCVTDKGAPPLTRYKRVVVTILPN
jgi:hypothetical protein